MKIKFIASNKHTYEVKEKPKPASEFIPEWWKGMPTYSTGKFDLDPNPTVTAKKCFPLLDGITAGYIFTLWSDILVTRTEDGHPVIKWVVSTPVVEAWPHMQSSSYEIPEGYSKTVFKNLHGWIIKTPKGYSSYITHPIGFPNLPFRTLTGIVDTDKGTFIASSPFVVKENYEGIIKKGTPMFQIIPFKRDDWESQIETQTEEKTFFDMEKLHSTLVSGYNQLFRSKKSYK